MPHSFDYPTFAGLPIGMIDDLEPCQVCVFGAAEATPYDPREASHSAAAPGAIRLRPSCSPDS